MNLNHVSTAFTQLYFSWKLYNYVLDGKIDREELDCDITFQSENQKQIFVLPPRLFDDDDDLIHAAQVNLGITFGATVIALDRARTDAGRNLPDPIVSETDQCIALIYQIRCAFAHDIAEPRWKIKLRFRREYKFGGMRFDLTDLDGEVFDYMHIGGIDMLVGIKNFAQDEGLIGFAAS